MLSITYINDQQYNFKFCSCFNISWYRFCTFIVHFCALLLFLLHLIYFISYLCNTYSCVNFAIKICFLKFKCSAIIFNFCVWKRKKDLFGVHWIWGNWSQNLGTEVAVWKFGNGRYLLWLQLKAPHVILSYTCHSNPGLLSLILYDMTGMLGSASSHGKSDRKAHKIVLFLSANLIKAFNTNDSNFLLHYLSAPCRFSVTQASFSQVHQNI